MQIAERVELLHPAEVEERVPGDDAGDVPEHHAEREPEQGDHQRGPRRRARHDTQCERQCHERDDAEDHEGEQDRAVHDEDEQQSRRERGEPPGHGRRRAAQSHGACDERSRQEQDERRRDEAEPEPGAVSREQARHPQQRQREEQDRRAASAAA